MSKKLSKFFVVGLLVLQGAGTVLNGFTHEVELTTAVLRFPTVCMARKVRSENKFREAALWGAFADFTRIANDTFALYNLCQKHDTNFYKWTKFAWVAQDIKSLYNNVKKLREKGLGESSEVSSEVDRELDSKLSDLLKKLDINFMPMVEGAAATLLAGATSGAEDGHCNNLVSLTLQALVSGSRLLSEMIEAKSGTMEQKRVLLFMVVHAAVVLCDLVRSKSGEQDDAPLELHRKRRQDGRSGAAPEPSAPPIPPGYQ